MKSGLREQANLAWSIALDFFHHNFIRIHQTLRMTPARKTGIAQDKRSIEDMVDLLPELSYNARPARKIS